MDWQEQIAKLTGSKHGDFIAVVRAGKDAKKRTNRLKRRRNRKLDEDYMDEVLGDRR